MRGMTKMRSSIKSTILDCGNEIFDLQLSPKDLAQWNDDSKRRYHNKVKALIENPDFCCDPAEGEERSVYDHGYRHDGLIKVHPICSTSNLFLPADILSLCFGY